MCDSPIFIVPRVGGQAVPVPCGRCPPCKNRRVNSWVFRLLQEEKVSSSAYFVTLTYDTRHVPISRNGFMTLCKRDYQLFMKRLRKLCPASTLKYYAAGEYGSDNNRPHFHAIVYNVPDQALFNEAWGLGSVFIGKVSSDSIAYCTKYIDKSNNNPVIPGWTAFAGRDDRVREFPLMSKGLGENYLSPDIVRYHQSDTSRVFVTKPGGYKMPLPRYYRLKIYDEAQRSVQAFLAQVATDKQDALNRLEYNRLYPNNPNYPYEAHQEAQKYGRYTQFYSNQKPRNV